MFHLVSLSLEVYHRTFFLDAVLSDRGSVFRLALVLVAVSLAGISKTRVSPCLVWALVARAGGLMRSWLPAG